MQRRIGGALALALLLPACGESRGPAPDPRPAGGGASATVPEGSYRGVGTVIATGADRITIAHGPIDGLGWPAMTMSFRLPPDSKGVRAGDRVAFAFRPVGGVARLTAIAKVR